MTLSTSTDRNDSTFFFQAEDGIRDLYVTGVQTCALPICTCGLTEPTAPATTRTTTRTPASTRVVGTARRASAAAARRWRHERSEERRVGEECRSRWVQWEGKKMRMMDVGGMTGEYD